MDKHIIECNKAQKEFFKGYKYKKLLESLIAKNKQEEE